MSFEAQKADCFLFAAAEWGGLFAEFGRTSNLPTGGECCTGSGLSIVKRLIEAQSGRVGAEFPEAGGSVFWFELLCGSRPKTQSTHPVRGLRTGSLA